MKNEAAATQERGVTPQIFPDMLSILHANLFWQWCLERLYSVMGIPLHVEWSHELYPALKTLRIFL